MAFDSKNPKTEAPVQKVAARKNTRHGNEPAREDGKPSLVELSMEFSREVRARGNPKKGRPADKAFIDSLYEDD